MKQFYLLLVLYFLLNNQTLAQLQIKQQRTLGGYNDDYLQAMDLTKDGGIIIGGTSISGISGEKTQNNTGLQDFWLLKLNDEGKIKWDKTIGGDGEDYLRFVKQVHDGYIVIGSSNSNISGQKTEQCKGDFDYWVIKLDKSGNILWSKTIGGSYADFFSSAEETDDGGFILAGYSYSNKSLDKTGNCRGGFDYWIVRIDKKGNVLWDKTIGGASDDLLTCVTRTPDGGFILGGYSISDASGEKTEPCRGVYDYWIVKISGSGKVEWDKTLGGASWDYLESVEQTKDRGYILGGYSYSDKSGDKTQHNKGQTDFWLVKLNKNGGKEWDKSLGGAENDFLLTIQQTADGGYIAAGSSNSYDINSKAFYTGNDFNYLFIKTNAKGEAQWSKMLGGSNNDFLSCVKPLSKNFWVTGGSSLSGKTGEKDQRNRGGSDFWVSVLKADTENEFTSLPSNDSSLSKSNQGFLVYPNPANNLVNVQAGNEGIFALSNIYGKNIATQKINGSGTINVSALAPGIYYLKNITTSEVQKILITR